MSNGGIGDGSDGAGVEEAATVELAAFDHEAEPERIVAMALESTDGVEERAGVSPVLVRVVGHRAKVMQCVPSSNAQEDDHDDDGSQMRTGWCRTRQLELARLTGARTFHLGADHESPPDRFQPALVDACPGVDTLLTTAA
jgi:hypothetical protein